MPPLLTWDNDADCLTTSTIQPPPIIVPSNFLPCLNLLLDYDNLLQNYDNLLQNYDNLLLDYNNLLLDYDNLLQNYDNLLLDKSRVNFIHGIHNLSRTNVECQWRKRKSSTSLSAQAVAEKCPPPKKYTALGRKPVQDDRAQLYEDLKQYGRFTDLWWLLSPEPPAVRKLLIPTVEDKIFSEEFLQTRGL